MVLGRPLRLAAAALAGLALIAIGPASPAHAVAVPAPDALAAATVAVQRATSVAVVVVRIVRGDTSWELGERYCGRGNAYQTGGVTVRSPQGGVRAPAAIWPGDVATVSCARSGTTTTRTATSSGWVAPLAGTLFVSGDCRVGGRGGHWLAQRTGHLHQGIDLPRPSGTPIRAVRAGVVSINRYSGGAGWYIAINHGGVTSDYMHLRSRAIVAVGTRVVAGQIIGYVGNTGASFGAHLHFEIRVGTGIWPRATNPSVFLRARGIRVGGC